MTGRIFTIFEGPDIGVEFSLDETPVTLGRDLERDIVLHDDRASRLHARIDLRGEHVFAIDENSSNGTFVNDKMINELELHEGDVLVIGRNHIIFGRTVPARDRRKQAAHARSQPFHDLAGQMTEIIPNDAIPHLHLAPARPVSIVKAFAEALHEETDARGFHISVEVEIDPDSAATATVDKPLLYSTPLNVLRHLLSAVPTGEAMIALRLSLDPDSQFFHMELICVGVPISRDRIAALTRAHVFREAYNVAAAHGGVFELLPEEAPDVLARLRLPVAPPDAMQGP